MSTEMNMDNIVWKSEYNIGNFTIDKEHQSLFEIARKVLTLVTKNNDKQENEKLKKLITELFEYIGTHFQNEQAYMSKIHYPELENHKKIHTNMLETLTYLIKDFNTLTTQEIEIGLYSFIYEYFIEHIIVEDKKIQLWNMSLDDLRKSFGWKEIYSIGNEELDNEHKNLFNIAKEAFMVVDDELRNEKIKKVVLDLYKYMNTHFSHEEKYMSEINYPKLNEHKILHEKIITSMDIFLKQFPSLSIELFEKELASLIDIYLVRHIIQEDKKILHWGKQRENTE